MREKRLSSAAGEMFIALVLLPSILLADAALGQSANPTPSPEIGGGLIESQTPLELLGSSEPIEVRSEPLLTPAPGEETLIYPDLETPAESPSVDPEPIYPDDKRIKTLEPTEEKWPVANLYALQAAPYRAYRRDESGLSFMPGDGDQFGWLSFEGSEYLRRRSRLGLNTVFNVHLLSGPKSAHLPPRLYDLGLGFQSRQSLSERFSYEWAFRAGIYSDFEDSARDGVRFPSHAVGMLHTSDSVDFVFGVDYLDRNDVQLLPVVGLVWHNPSRPQWRYEMVFPRPRIDWTLSPQSRVYWAGVLGGGTWDIELPNEQNDVMTYRDYRLLMGFEKQDDDGSLSSWELGWVFSRHLEFRGRPDEFGFDDAFLLRFISRH